MNARLILPCTLAAILAVVPRTGAAAALSRDALAKLLAQVDERTRSDTDYKALAYILEKEPNKPDKATEMLVYRRDATDSMMILMVKPRSESGKGYLRTDRNLWFYDSTIGKWERRTDREQIGGTNTRKHDFDRTHLVEEYVPQYEADEKVGAVPTHRLKLTAQPGRDLAVPLLRVWIDVAEGNLIKRQEYSLSGKPLRTVYLTKWRKAVSNASKKEMWYPQEIRILDEIEKQRITSMALRDVDLRALDQSIFSKAWLESKSR